MADLFTVTVDALALDEAITRMPEVLAALVLEACKETAEAVVREAQGRLRRQLGPNATGETAAGIHAVKSFDGNGYVILADNARMPNLPLWLEKGTRPGKRRNFARTAPRPFFYTSIELEYSAHERRLQDAMIEAAAEMGMGE